MDSTLIVWGGEFGRTVVKDRNGNATPGRDHNGRVLRMGGRWRVTAPHGATDEFGSRGGEQVTCTICATILALMGFDHTKLTYRYNGRDFRFTDNYGNVVKDGIA